MNEKLNRKNDKAIKLYNKKFKTVESDVKHLAKKLGLDQKANLEKLLDGNSENLKEYTHKNIFTSIVKTMSKISMALGVGINVLGSGLAINAMIKDSRIKFRIIAALGLIMSISGTIFIITSTNILLKDASIKGTPTYERIKEAYLAFVKLKKVITTDPIEGIKQMYTIFLAKIKHYFQFLFKILRTNIICRTTYLINVFALFVFQGLAFGG